MILLSLGNRGRGYKGGYRIFNDEKELFEFVENNKTNQSLHQHAWSRYSIFEVTEHSSKSIKRKYSEKIRKITSQCKVDIFGTKGVTA